jgi:hypothetical protein
MRRPRLTKPFQRFIHLFGLLAGWAIFVWFWWHVLTTQSIDHAVLGWLIIGSLVLFPLITFAWVAHNVALFHSKGARTQVREIKKQYSRDWTGRSVEANWPAIRAARAIDIRLDDGIKQFVIR